MTPDAIARIRTSFADISTEPRVLAGRFYTELFAAAPQLRGLFPVDLTSLQGHFEAALALVIRNLEEMRTLEQPLRELGAQHVGWGAKPEDYVLVREALIRAIRGSSADWNDTIEGDWRRAITAIAVPMLEGAAVHTAMVAERLSEE
jgi:hemoglobin-like flavoprotein